VSQRVTQRTTPRLVCHHALRPPCLPHEPCVRAIAQKRRAAGVVVANSGPPSRRRVICCAGQQTARQVPPRRWPSTQAAEQTAFMIATGPRAAETAANAPRARCVPLQLHCPSPPPFARPSGARIMVHPCFHITSPPNHHQTTHNDSSH
jgi:hypothetical protein